MGHNTEYINCNLCGNNVYDVVYKKTSDEEGDIKGKYISSSNEIVTSQIVKCSNCGLIYVNPRIKSNLILESYSESPDEVFVSQAKGREITFRKSLKYIEKFVDGKGKILDIGTAGGSFLHVAKQGGWKVYGIEPNKWLCEWSKKRYNLDLKQGTILDTNYLENHFDVITLWDVLEHVPDPTEVLVEVNRILKPGGLLVVNYPDINSWIAKLMKKKWGFLLAVHIYYFTPKTIKKMLKKTGFEIFKIKPHFQKLGLGYLVYRIKPYNEMLYKINNKIIRALKIEDLQLPYWFGQTLVLAKKE